MFSRRWHEECRLLGRVVLVRTDISKKCSASIIRLTRICELGMLAVTTSRQMLRFLSSWWWRCCVPPKRRFLQEPHGVTFQKTACFSYFMCFHNIHYCSVLHKPFLWFWIYLRGWSGTKSTINAPICWLVVPVLDDRWWWLEQLMEWIVARKTEVLGENMSEGRSVQHISLHHLNQARTRTAAVISRRLIAWATAQPGASYSYRSETPNITLVLATGNGFSLRSLLLYEDLH
jgi:hypothetical protein